MRRFGQRTSRGIAAIALAGGLVCSGAALVLVEGAAEAGATTGDNDLALSQPSNIIVDITSPGQTSAVVTYSLPTASDPDDTTAPPTPSCTPASGSAFSIGVTTVTCTVRAVLDGADIAEVAVPTGAYQVTVNRWVVPIPTGR